jgi:hypothetical protein
MSLHEARQRLTAQLGAAVHSALVPFAQQMTLVTRTNPHAAATELLARPDVHGALTAGLARAQRMASGVVRQAWEAGGGPPDSPVLAVLLKDVSDAYAAAAGRFAGAVTAAHHSVQTRTFEPGVTPPGSQPIMESAGERAGAVATAIRGEADRLLVSNRSTMDVAASGSLTARTLEEGYRLRAAGYTVLKEWVSRLKPTTCHWCRQLHGTVIPLEQEFSHGTVHEFPHSKIRHVRTAAGQHHFHRDIGAPIIMTWPPRVRGRLLGPPRHVRCECELRLHVLGAGEGPPAPAPPAPEHEHPYLRASDIASLPDKQYHSLLAFISAAVHELRLQIRRLLGL